MAKSGSVNEQLVITVMAAVIITKEVIKEFNAIDITTCIKQKWPQIETGWTKNGGGNNFDTRISGIMSDLARQKEIFVLSHKSGNENIYILTKSFDEQVEEILHRFLDKIGCDEIFYDQNNDLNIYYSDVDDFFIDTDIISILLKYINSVREANGEDPFKLFE